jgi:MFS superfamily sulfate permease-like transporter
MKLGKFVSGDSPRRDLLASVVVFLVALPLCMGIAVASGAPPAAGLISGIVGGLVCGALAGCPLQVSGPAAGLTVVAWQIIQQHGLAALGVVVLCAGLLQLAAGALRIGQVFRAVAPAVIHGMLAGIGVLIFASQFHVMVDAAPRGSGIGNLLGIPASIGKAIAPEAGKAHHWAALVGLLSLTTIVAWKAWAPKSLKFVPPPLAAVLVAMPAALLALPIQFVELPKNLLESVTLPTWATITEVLSSQSGMLAVITVAVVASAETLLCATAVDKMHNGPRTKYDRELIAQGCGNVLCGALGALPVTGVIVRSGANVQAGAQTRRSAILHGVWLLVFVAMLPGLLRMIPTASLAAILVYTGAKLVDIKNIRELLKVGRGEFAIYLVTLVGIVAFDLLTGVLAGVALSLLRLLYTFAHLDVSLEPLPARGQTVLHLRGAATFIRLPRLAAALERVPCNCELHVHLEELAYVDHACLDLLMTWEQQHEAAGGRLVIDWDKLTARFQSTGVATVPRIGRNGEISRTTRDEDRTLTPAGVA